MIQEWHHQSFAESPDPGADNGAVAVHLESKVVENYRKCFDRLFDSIQVEAESRVWQDESQEKEKARMHDVFRSYIKAYETKFLQKDERIAQLEAQSALGMLVHAQRIVQRMRHRLLAYAFDVLHGFVENAKQEKHKRDHYIQEQEREKGRRKEQEGQRARRIEYVARHIVQRMQDGLLAYAFDVLHRFAMTSALSSISGCLLVLSFLLKKKHRKEKSFIPKSKLIF